ncbi:MAG: hypothetical protein J6W03_08055 [Bacteroidaceae bacterium]|nr:hypothetical protein [Bacteroidaceae bacterium]
MKNIIIGLIACFMLFSCSSEPEWADPEAHEKTEQLREQYTTLIVGTWHYESISERQRVFEQLTFKADGTFSGQRKWQGRQLVTIGGEEHYTDWEDIPQTNGTFTGTWSLKWERNVNGVGENRLYLYAKYDNENYDSLPYSTNALFDSADANTLRFAGYWQNSEGWTTYQRGEAEPSF